MRHYRVTLADVLAAHDKALTYGGRAGTLSIDVIASAIGRPYSGYHRRIERKAAALLHALVRNHGFVDGNKRTALLVTDLLIRRSGYTLALHAEDRFDDVVVEIAEGRMDMEVVTAWFRERLSPTPDRP